MSEHKITIVEVDPRRPEIVQMIAELDRLMTSLYPVENTFLVSPEDLAETGSTFIAAYVDGVASGCAAIMLRGQDYAEVKRVYVAPNARGLGLARRLLAEPEVLAIGLGARDSLRLEAGLCLYGHDIDETTTPVEAGLVWAIDKRRRETRGFPGADIILKQLHEGATRRRVGLQPEGRAPAREGTAIVSKDGIPLGTITSGGFGPTVGRPVAMGYVNSGSAVVGTELDLIVRGKPLAGHIEKMPFTAPGYKR